MGGAFLAVLCGVIRHVIYLGAKWIDATSPVFPGPSKPSRLAVVPESDIIEVHDEWASPGPETIREPRLA